MPNYKYKSTKCKRLFQRFLAGFKTPDEDPNHDVPCDCDNWGCYRIRIISLPAPPMGFRVWAGDWYKKEYGHELGERDKAYASEQADLDKQVHELKQQHGINVKSKAVKKEE